MKKRILFVDDEPNVLRGLRRMLRHLRDEWEVRFKGGEQGLAERVGEFIRSGGGEEVLVQHPTEDLESLFLRVFRGT